MLGLLTRVLLAYTARAGDGEATNNLRGAAMQKPPARVVAPVFPWPPDGTEPDCRDEAAWASSEGLNCAQVARDAAALCRARPRVISRRLGRSRRLCLTRAPSPACADDPTWSYGTKASNTCAYVAQKLKRCKSKNTDGIRSALEACPATCGTCPTWRPTEAPTLKLYPPTPRPTLSTTVRPPDPTPGPSTRRTPEPTPGQSTRGPTPGPSRQPTPSTSCVDDATWCYGSCSPNDCAYVAQKLKRCKAKNTDGVRTALEACPLTCGTCSAPAPTPTLEPTRRPAPEATPGPTPGPAPRAPSPTPHPTPTPYHPAPTYAPSPRCADDAMWSYGTKASNTCAYVARKLKRCKAKNTDGVRTALEACPVTCSTC